MGRGSGWVGVGSGAGVGSGGSGSGMGGVGGSGVTAHVYPQTASPERRLTGGCRPSGGDGVVWCCPRAIRRRQTHEEDIEMASRGTTFAKQDRDRAKKAKAALKRERRLETP